MDKYLFHVDKLFFSNSFKHAGVQNDRTLRQEYTFALFGKNLDKMLTEIDCAVKNNYISEV